MTTQPVLSVSNLTVHFQIRRGNPLRPSRVVHAVDDASFDVAPGETLALVGESGSGKTTTALSIMRLVPVTSGRVFMNGTDLTALRGKNLRRARRDFQMIFQDPYSSLNPRERVGSIVRAPLDIMELGTSDERERLVAQLFEEVGLRPEQKALFPHQFSGGQRQRINIARALASRPRLIVCDEPVSALDVAIRAQILNLLRRLQREMALSYVFISHDMAVVEYISDEIAVMYLGEIVERARRREFFSRPLHPYSLALLSAVPKMGARRRQADMIKLKGDPPSPIDLPSGCRFAGRCQFTEQRCRREAPALREVAPGHWVRCHLVSGEAA